MTKTSIVQSWYVSSKTLVTLFEELQEECQNVLRLLAQLQLNNLTTEQQGDILAGLGAAVLHLHEHTRGLDGLIDKELEKLPDQ